MTSKKEFEIFLYKNKLNELSLIDILDNLSAKTIGYLMRDLDIKVKKINSCNTLYIFTDGGCKNNGKNNCKGGYGVYFTDNPSSPFYKLNTVELIREQPTNQKAELLAIHKAFCLLNTNIELIVDISKIVIVTDSMYSIKCVKEWSKSWIKNNWVTSKGEKVKNEDIIKDILSSEETLRKNGSRDLQIEFKHIFSHTQEPKNSDSLEYLLWDGNNKIDTMINIVLTS